VCSFVLAYSSFCSCVAFAVLGLVSSVLSQEIGWEESLRNDLFCVEWDVKPQLRCSAPAGWNSMLKTVLSSDSVTVFKLRTFLFSILSAH